LRLARFNTEITTEPQPHVAGFFSGVPAPGGAGLSLVPMFISFEWGDWIARSPYVNAVWLGGIAVLMISRVPTVSLKPIRIPHDLVLPTLLGVGVFAGLFTTAPWPTLTFIGAVYVGSIPLTVRAYYRLRRAAEARKTEAAEAAPAQAPPPAIPLTGHEPANEWRH
jgi:CDP-diacylglycerol--serine O-phosphatidyltransferase